MNIVIFSPVVEFSAIAMSNNLLVVTLQKMGHTLSVVRTEYNDFINLPSLVKTCAVIKWFEREEVLAATEQADLVVYQIGDNYSLHVGGVEWLPHASGLVCLHDYYLGNLFNGFASVSGKERAEKILSSLYPEVEPQDFFSASSQLPEVFIDKTRIVTPMTEWIATMALGIVVHSSWDIQRLIASCPGPVYVQPLPHIKPINANEELFNKTIGARDRSKTNQIINVLTIGNANENKRISSIIQAISRSKNRSRLHYHVAGHVEDAKRKKYQSLADRLEVKLTLWGQVSDEELHAIIEQTDLITCLRWPTLESASASLIEALLSKRPVIVTDAGFYAELPDEIVFKIDPEIEMPDLVATLDKLIHLSDEDKDLLEQHTEKAYAWALETFCVKKYAAALVDIANEIKNPQTLVRLSNYFAYILNQWNSKGISSLNLPNLEIFS